MRRVRPPEGFDEAGEPFWYLREVRHPGLHRLNRIRLRILDTLYRGRLYWRWRLPGWALFAIPPAFVRLWLAPAGIVVFELLVIGLMQWSWHRASRSKVPPLPG